MAFRKLVLQPECRKRENSDVGHESTGYTSCLERPPCTHDCGMKKLEQGVKAHYSFSFINKKKEANAIRNSREDKNLDNEVLSRHDKNNKEV